MRLEVKNNDPDGGLAVYILDDDTILFSRKEYGHTQYWEKIVCKIVTKKYKINKSIINLPYCQRRARIVENKMYCGEKITNKLLKKIEKTINIKLKYVYDEHEKRCDISVTAFKGYCR